MCFAASYFNLKNTCAVLLSEFANSQYQSWFYALR
jgi:hypothetical protein